MIFSSIWITRSFGERKTIQKVSEICIFAPAYEFAVLSRLDRVVNTIWRQKGTQRPRRLKIRRSHNEVKKFLLRTRAFAQNYEHNHGNDKMGKGKELKREHNTIQKLK